TRLLYCRALYCKLPIEARGARAVAPTREARRVLGQKGEAQEKACDPACQVAANRARSALSADPKSALQARAICMFGRGHPLIDRVKDGVDKLKQQNPTSPVSIDLVTTSGGG